MSLRDIVLYPSDVLAQRADEVDQVDDAIRTIVDDMIQTMYAAPGIGLAAPQVGLLQRITVIDISNDERPDKLHVLINPRIVHAQGHILWEEGCLSIPGIYEKVERAAQVVVQALNREGQQVELEAEGLLAVALQHEIDHLDGVLFLDYLSPLKRRRAVARYRKNIEELERERKNPKKKTPEAEADA